MLTMVVSDQERDITGIQDLVAGTADVLIFENFYNPDQGYGAARFHSHGGMLAYLHFLEQTETTLTIQTQAPAEAEWLNKLRILIDYCKGYTLVRTPGEIEAYLNRFVELVQAVYDPHIEGHSIRLKKGETIAEIRERHRETQKRLQD